MRQHLKGGKNCHVIELGDHTSLSFFHLYHPLPSCLLVLFHQIDKVYLSIRVRESLQGGKGPSPSPCQGGKALRSQIIQIGRAYYLS